MLSTAENHIAKARLGKFYPFDKGLSLKTSTGVKIPYISCLRPSVSEITFESNVDADSFYKVEDYSIRINIVFIKNLSDRRNTYE